MGPASRSSGSPSGWPPQQVQRHGQDSCRLPTQHPCRHPATVVTRIPARPQLTSSSFLQLGLGHTPPQTPPYPGVLGGSKEDTSEEALALGCESLDSSLGIQSAFPTPWSRGMPRRSAFSVMAGRERRAIQVLSRVGKATSSSCQSCELWSQVGLDSKPSPAASSCVTFV